ncbi:MAG: prepilin-type N-terminal cleavage/methylation domain-containing protein [Candidatus Omnitrophica bacterium]|nr:prepilin-type N-terminal cleavage/methylation domain-containing protein [Candidatus Omnitrophota bacterium]
MDKKGFTLVEIMIVVGVLALLMAISLPILSRMRQNANEAKTQAELNSLYKAVNMYYAYNGRYPSELSELSDYITIANIDNKYELNSDLP